MRVPLLLAGLMVSCVQSPAVVFESELWPGEGRPAFEAASDSLVLLEAPLPSAAVARTMPVDRGTQILFDSTRFQTVEPGQFRVLMDTVLVGRNLGPTRYLSRGDYYNGKFPREHRRITAGETIEYLQYRAEGTCFVRVDGAVFEAEPCPLVQQALFELVDEPTVDWWIRVIVEEEPRGWLRVEDSAVREVGRLF